MHEQSGMLKTNIRKGWLRGENFSYSSLLRCTALLMLSILMRIDKARQSYSAETTGVIKKKRSDEERPKSALSTISVVESNSSVKLSISVMKTLGMRRGHLVPGWLERTYEFSAHTISKEQVPSVRKLPLVGIVLLAYIWLRLRA